MKRPRLAEKIHNSTSWRWSKAEDVFIKRFAGKQPAEDISRFLIRSLAEVRHRIKHFGLSSAFHTHTPGDASDLIGVKFGDWVVVKQGPKTRVGATYHSTVICKNTKHPHVKNRLWQASRIRRGKVAGKTLGLGHVDAQGYRHITVDGKTVSEHRHVVDQALRKRGLKLTKWMSVHHRNGIRTDNRLKNLQIKPFRHGKGQEVPDMIHHLRELGCRVFVPKKVRALY